MSAREIFDRAVREAGDRWAEQKDNLVFACMVYHKIDSPLDIVLCEQRTLTAIRVWTIEPMTTKLRDAEMARLDAEVGSPRSTRRTPSCAPRSPV
jgi:hypothetical protein